MYKLNEFTRKKRYIVGLSQRQMAAQMGFESHTFIGHVERNQAHWGIEHLKKLSDVLGCPRRQLCDLWVADKRAMAERALGLKGR